MKRIMIAGEIDKTVNYEAVLEAEGAEPVTTLHVPDVEVYNGLVLPGGGDVDPLLFGQVPQKRQNVSPRLDRLQLAILQAFIEAKKPVLGICKGM